MPTLACCLRAFSEVGLSSLRTAPWEFAAGDSLVSKSPFDSNVQLTT